MTWLVWVKDNKFKLEFCIRDEKTTPYIAVNVNVNDHAVDEYCWLKKGK